VHPGGIKTNIAKATRMSDSVKAVTGLDNHTVSSEFERAFITSPETAAKKIIKSVRKNRRRVLIGPDSHLYDYIARLAPSSYQRVFTAFVRWRKNKV